MITASGDGCTPGEEGIVGLSQLSPKRLRALEHDVQALRLRIDGATFEEIAVALGYRTRSAAWKCVFRARTRRLLELRALLERLPLADAARQLAALERRVPVGPAGGGLRQRRRAAAERLPRR